MSDGSRDTLLTVVGIMIVLFVGIAVLSILISTYGSCQQDYVRVVTETFRGCIPWQEALKK